MKKCSNCGGKITEKIAKIGEAVNYKYFKCRYCKEEILDMKQLHNVAKKYKNIK